MSEALEWFPLSGHAGDALPGEVWDGVRGTFTPRAQGATGVGGVHAMVGGDQATPGA